MYQRYFDSSFWARRALLPRFNLAGLERTLAVMAAPSFHRLDSALMLWTSHAMGEYKPKGEEVLLERLSEGDVCSVLLSVPRATAFKKQPYGAFDAKLRYLVKTFVPRERTSCPFTAEFSVPFKLLGVTREQVMAPHGGTSVLIDLIGDYHDQTGLMFPGGSRSYDPDKPYARVGVEARISEDDRGEHLRARCFAYTGADLLGVWTEVLRRLRPQYDEPAWNWAILCTYLLDAGYDSPDVRLKRYEDGFFASGPVAAWLQKPELHGWSRGFKQGENAERPTEHFTAKPAPAWLGERSFTVHGTAEGDRCGLWCAWV